MTAAYSIPVLLGARSPPPSWWIAPRGVVGGPSLSSGRVGEERCRPSPPSEPCVRLSPHTAQASHLRTPGQVLINNSRRHHGVPLLVAVQVHQFPVATRVRSAHAPWSLVVAVQFLTVDEVHATHRTSPVLGFGQQHIVTGQAADVDLPPCPPVFPQTRVVGRRRAPHQGVPDDLEPTELQQVPP